MPCLSPLDAWWSKFRHPVSGKRIPVFSFREAYHDLSFTLPCGQCRFCRLEKSRQIAIRATHEASLYERNCFLTLTYNDEHLPENGSISKEHPVEFVKKLRERIRYDLKKRGLSKTEREKFAIRTYGCAEYGEKFQRPHYHLLIFNFDFPDKKLLKTHRGHSYFTSELLTELWGQGHAVTAALTFESAAYVARYVTKKITGPRAEAAYQGRLPEQPICVPHKVGLGKPFLKKFLTDVYPSDEVILRGKTMRPPKYYDRIFELEYPSDMAKIKRSRKRKALAHAEKHPDESRGYRQMAKKEIQEIRFQQLKRNYENDS